MDNKSGEAQAQLCICNAHLGKVALDAAKKKFPAMADSMGAVQAAKAAYRAFSELSDPEGIERASRSLSSALLATGVPASTMPSPEALVQSKDLATVVSDCGGNMSPFQAPQLQVRNVPAAGKKQQSQQFDRTNFRWRDPTAEYCYTLIWEPYKEANFATRKKNYNATAVSQGARSAALPLYHSLKPKDPAMTSDGPLCVHILAYDASQDYGSSLMGSLHTISSMVTANLKKLTFVQLGEAPYEGAKAPNQWAARHVAMSPCTLALIRSARIEVPQLAIGFVAGDAASWMTERDTIVNAIFDAPDAQETELMWSRGKPMMPTLLPKPLPEPVQRKMKAPHE